MAEKIAALFRGYVVPCVESFQQHVDEAANVTPVANG
jgi:hypothetical protein